jgi:hypothetical protein
MSGDLSSRLQEAYSLRQVRCDRMGPYDFALQST